MTTKSKKAWQTFEGHALFRHRVVLSVLTATPIRVQEIRPDSASPGLRPHEVSFLRLVEQLTNGTIVDVSKTGTSFRLRPGTLHGGKHTHACEGDRGIGWFLEGLLCLLPFAKIPTVLTLRGITNEGRDQGVDAIRTVTLPLLLPFGLTEGLELKVLKRGASPLGGGEVRLVCPPVRALKPVSLLDEGRVKRVRGIAFSTRVSPQMSNRVVESARAVLNNYLPDVYIYTDHYKGEESGLSPGYGVCLVAESTTGAQHCAEVVAEKGELPEDVGTHAANMLLEGVRLGGCVDMSNQALVFLFMALGPEDVSKVRVGRLSHFSVQFLRLVRKMVGVTFKIKTDNDSVVLSCLGVGYQNLAKATA